MIIDMIMIGLWYTLLRIDWLVSTKPGKEEWVDFRLTPTMQNIEYNKLVKVSTNLCAKNGQYMSKISITIFCISMWGCNLIEHHIVETLMKEDFSE